MTFLKTARSLIILAVFCLLATAAMAQASLEKFAAKYPNNPEVLNSYGIELANSGDLVGAITVWRRALNYDRKNVHLYNNIGSALKRLGHDEHAFAWYAAALQIKPVYWTYYNLAILYRDRGQVKEASWALAQSLRLNPQFPQAIEMRKHIGLAPQKSAQTTVKIPESFPDSALIGRQKHEKAESAPTLKPETVKLAPTFATPTTQKPAHQNKRLVNRISPLPADAGGQVFLTFDGGATDAGFDSIVDSLRRYGVRCTFFLTGKFAEKYPLKCRMLLSEGHEIANHSMNHPNMKNFSKAKIAAEIEAAEQAFARVLGKRGAPFFRFPFGAQNKKVEQIVEELGYHPVYWHIDTIDWREDPVNTIISRVDSKLRRNAVILMHLGSKNGAKALDRILDIITGRGYTLARLSDLDASQLAALP